MTRMPDAHRIRKDAAVGVDGVTKEEYGRDLESNLADLHGRLRAERYRHQPIRRVHIPKGHGKTERMKGVLEKQPSLFGLRLSPDKKRLLDFRRPLRDHKGGKGPGSFDFLGFSHYWRRGRKGAWQPAWKTRRKSLRRAIISLQSWCKANRHMPIPEQHVALTRRIQGHYNYFGVNGNHRSLSMILYKVERFSGILQQLPLPKVRVYRNLWTTS